MTSFEKIFDIFMSETKHTSLAKLSEADLVYVLEHYLETSALVEFKKCRKDLSKYTKTTFVRLINGYVDEEIKDIDPEFSVGSKTKEGFDIDSDMNVYPDNEPDNSFDSDMNVTPEEEWNEDEGFSAEFDITYKIKQLGYFEEDLTHEECYILASSMILHQLQSNLNREEYFKRTITDRDFKLSGGDKILASIMELEKRTRKKLKKYMNSYSYNNFNELREI